MNENGEVREIEEAPQALNEPKKPTKLELKRQQITQERIQRKMTSGMSFEAAVAAVQREDYENLSPAEKIKRLEAAIISNLQKLARDISLLSDNQRDLADVMDVNFRAFEKMLAKVGLAPDAQHALMEEAAAEVQAEREARVRKQQADQEEAKKRALAEEVDAPGTTEIPEGATVFGG